MSPGNLINGCCDFQKGEERVIFPLSAQGPVDAALLAVRLAAVQAGGEAFCSEGGPEDLSPLHRTFLPTLSLGVLFSPSLNISIVFAFLITKVFAHSKEFCKE